MNDYKKENEYKDTKQVETTKTIFKREEQGKEYETTYRMDIAKSVYEYDEDAIDKRKTMSYSKVITTLEKEEYDVIIDYLKERGAI